ncbi:MAG: hypothetical protein M1617_04845 [Actinobacteria bacterium]|nr:hypothetical protein [Actinomycetota bacterium]MCL5887617.1 hypothetical protein [Actinomycetota bacterium]
MRQGRFEFWLICVGAIVVVASVAIVGGEILVEELIAQVMLYAVFVAAVFGGTSSGLVAALAFSIVYIAIQVGFRADEVVFSWDLVQMILVRVIAFSAIGVIVGEMTTRIRKRFDQSKELEGIDPVSRGYNQRLVASALEMAIAESQRYAVPFSVTLIRLTLNPNKSPKAGHQENIIRRISESVRTSTRVLDRFGRTDDGILVLISPNTSLNQIEVLKARLEENIQKSFGEQLDELSITSLSAPEKIQEIIEYHQRLQRDPKT